MKTKNNITELVIILDRSGSMHELTDDTIGGFNSLIEQHKAKGSNVLVTTVLFDNVSETVHDRIPISEVPAMDRSTYFTRGCTALIDALGDTISHIETVHKYIRKEDIPEHTLFMITTDGMENASTKYTSDKVKKMIEAKTELGWEFIYLAANIDAVETAKDYGIKADRSVNYHNDKCGTAAKFRSMSNAFEMVCEGKTLDSPSWRKEADEDFKSR